MLRSLVFLSERVESEASSEVVLGEELDNIMAEITGLNQIIMP